MTGPKTRRMARREGAVVGIFVPIDEADVDDLVEATADLDDEDEDSSDYDDEIDDE